MGRGDAFNRGEVVSTSVTAESRWVVSAIAGLGDSDARTPQEAAELFTDRARSGSLTVAVHDRYTGLTELFEVG